MIPSSPNVSIQVDVLNPGQFFACCGLLELADRLRPGTEGWFEQSQFHLTFPESLAWLIQQISRAQLRSLDPRDPRTSPLELGDPIYPPLRLDWWHQKEQKDLKLWAGRMEGFRIARAMQGALQNDEFFCPNLFNVAKVIYDPDNPEQKVEPFYFDARRASNAYAQDVGFSADSIKMPTLAYPAVEFLCLIGLQRARPAPTSRPRIFTYSTWKYPLPLTLIPVAVTGMLPGAIGQTYRFESWFRAAQQNRSQQKKIVYKAFRFAQPISQGESL